MRSNLTLVWAETQTTEALMEHWTRRVTEAAIVKWAQAPWRGSYATV